MNDDPPAKVSDVRAAVRAELPHALSASDRAARRRRRRTILFWVFALAAVALALLLIRCGGGFGFGDGDGLGAGTGTAPGRNAVATQPPARCQLRVDAAGLTLAARPTTVAAAVAACRATAGAEVVVTGDARQGQWDELRAALDAARIPSLVSGGGAAPAIDAGTTPP